MCFLFIPPSSRTHIDQPLMCEVAESKSETKLVNICNYVWVACISYIDMDVSGNSGNPESSILIGFSIIFTIHFWVPLFSETSMYYLHCIRVYHQKRNIKVRKPKSVESSFQAPIGINWIAGFDPHVVVSCSFPAFWIGTWCVFCQTCVFYTGIK